MTAFYTNFAKLRGGLDVVPYGRAIWRTSVQSTNALVYTMDGNGHLQGAGAYLQGCTAYSHLMHLQPASNFPGGGNNYTYNAKIPSLLPNQAGFFQRIAWDTHMSTVFTNPPKVTTSIPNYGLLSNLVTMSVTAIDDGSITNYIWTFGDGSTTNGSVLTNVTHQYNTTKTMVCDIA